uniref:Uncharacterized protein n=1 Tax=Timema poppense TaxID=170557 RepID=A0A7R9H0Q3_TIMPO|nr:unnamed protein product [Timema poppensis]
MLQPTWGKAGKVLKVLFPKMPRFTCLNHALHRICLEIRGLFPEVDALISNTKKILLRSPTSIQLFNTVVSGLALTPHLFRYMMCKSTRVYLDYKIGWLVGALAASVFVLTLLLITVAVCRCRNQVRPEKCNLGNPRLAGSSFSKDPSRYTDPPSKIDFQFREIPGRAATPETLSGQHQHIYERVDRYLAPTTCKSIYENVD